MGKPNYYKNDTSPSFDELSTLIISSIEQEQFFRKDILVPKVRALLSAFKINVAAAKYNKIETPTESARRLRELEMRNCECVFWKRKVMDMVNDIQPYYELLDKYLEENGFHKK